MPEDGQVAYFLDHSAVVYVPEHPAKLAGNLKMNGFHSDPNVLRGVFSGIRPTSCTIIILALYDLDPRDATNAIEFKAHRPLGSTCRCQAWHSTIHRALDFVRQVFLDFYSMALPIFLPSLGILS